MNNKTLEQAAREYVDKYFYHANGIGLDQYKDTVAITCFVDGWNAGQEQLTAELTTLKESHAKEESCWLITMDSKNAELAEKDQRIRQQSLQKT